MSKLGANKVKVSTKVGFENINLFLELERPNTTFDIPDNLANSAI